MPAAMRIPADPKRTSAIRAAIDHLGGLNKAAKLLGYATGERVRQFYAFGLPVPAEKCRRFVAVSDGRLTLAQLRPDIYAGLTARELGYKPRAR